MNTECLSRKKEKGNLRGMEIKWDRQEQSDRYWNKKIKITWEVNRNQIRQTRTKKSKILLKEKENNRGKDKTEK